MNKTHRFFHLICGDHVSVDQRLVMYGGPADPGCCKLLDCVAQGENVSVFDWRILYVAKSVSAINLSLVISRQRYQILWAQLHQISSLLYKEA